MGSILIQTYPVHFGANCVGSKMRIPYNPELCSRSIIDNPRHLEWDLPAYTACANWFFIYALPKQGQVHPRGHRVRSGKSMALEPRATETRLGNIPLKG